MSKAFATPLSTSHTYSFFSPLPKPYAVATRRPLGETAALWYIVDSDSGKTLGAEPSSGTTTARLKPAPKTYRPCPSTAT